MTVRSAVVRLTADVTGLLAGYGKAEAATKSLAESGLVLTQKHKAAVNTVTKGFGLMGAAAAAGLGLAVKTAADFDQKMSGVKAATGEGADGMDRLRAAAIKAGADTVFSAGEAADGITNLAKAGISTADILKGGLNGALSLASAGQIEVGDAAEYMATALTQFNLKGTDASHVADLLAAGANKAQGEVGDMADALNYAGIPAAQLGVSIEQTAGTIALFAKSGLIGSQAGTSLRGVLSSITSPSKIAAKTMGDLGISVFDAHGKFIGLDGVAQQLHDHMGSLTQEERSNALGRIFGNQQLQAANILYKNGAAGVDEWTKKVDDSGAAARTAATKMDNLKGDVEQLSGSLQTALIGTGEGSQTPLRSLTQHLTAVVNKYNDLGPAAQSNVAKAVGAVALLGGGGYVVGKAVIGVSNVVDAVGNLGVTADHTKGLLKGMVAAGVIVGLERLAEDFLNAHNNAHELMQDLQLMALGVPASPKLDFGFKNLGQELKEASQESKIFGDNIGLLSHFPGFMQTTDNIKQIDAQLSKLAKKDPKAASSAFAAIKEQAREAGVSMKDLMALFPKFEAVINEPRKAKSSLINLGDLLSGLHGLREYKSELMKLPREVLTKVVNPGMLTTTKQVVALGKQYKNLSAQDIRVIMRARDFASPEIHKVLKALGLLDKQHPKPTLDANATPAHHNIELTGQAASRFGGMRPTANLMADPHPALSAIQVALHTLGVYGKQHPSATLGVNNAAAMQAIARTQAAINDLHGTSITNTVTTIHRGGIQKAAGGLITGPGTATSDSIDARLSNGEYVVKTAAVNYYGPDFFHKANAMQLAGGGYVSRSSSAGGGAAGSTGRSLTVNNNYNGPINTVDADAFLRRNEQRQRDALALMSLPA